MLFSSGFTPRSFNRFCLLLIFGFVLHLGVLSAEERKFNFGKYVLDLKKRMLGLWADLLKVENNVIFQLENKRKFDQARAFNRFISARNQCLGLRKSIATLRKKVPSGDLSIPAIAAMNPMIREAQEIHASNIKRLRELAPKRINQAIQKANAELEQSEETASRTFDFPLRSIDDSFDTESEVASKSANSEEK